MTRPTLPHRTLELVALTLLVLVAWRALAIRTVLLADLHRAERHAWGVGRRAALTVPDRLSGVPVRDDRLLHG